MDYAQIRLAFQCFSIFMMEINTQIGWHFVQMTNLLTSLVVPPQIQWGEEGGDLMSFYCIGNLAIWAKSWLALYSLPIWLCNCSLHRKLSCGIFFNFSIQFGCRNQLLQNLCQLKIELFLCTPCQLKVSPKDRHRTLKIARIVKENIKNIFKKIVKRSLLTLKDRQQTPKDRRMLADYWQGKMFW